MDLLEAINIRRSIRKYKKQALPEVIIEKLLEAARQAPSAGNVQPWEFVVAITQRNKTELAQAAFSQKSIEDA